MSTTDRQNFLVAIASQYGRRLRRFLSARVRNSADVPDLAQEVFLRLLRVEHPDAIRSPEAYLFTVASHVISQHTQRQAAAPVSLEITELYPELHALASSDPEAQAETRERLRALELALADLPPRVSATLLLHRMGGYSIAEIGQRLGVARPTAKKYLAQALVHCRERYRDGH